MKNITVMLVFLFSVISEAMIIDSHVHLSSPENFPQETWTTESLISEMNEAGIGKAFVMSSAYMIKDQSVAMFENDFISREMSKYPQRLYGFCGINPVLDWAIEEVKRCHSKGNFHGIKIHTNLFKMDLDNEDTVRRLNSIFELVNDLGWTVLIHSGQWSVKETLTIFSMTYNYPEAKFILGHGLSEGYRNLIIAHAIRKEAPDFGKNLFLEISGLVPIYADSPEAESLLWHMRMFGMDNVLFGSDYPLFSFSETISALSRLGLSQEEIDKITDRNFQVFSFLNNK